MEMGGQSTTGYYGFNPYYSLSLQDNIDCNYTCESDTTELSSLMASSTNNLFGFALFFKIAVAKSSLLQIKQTSVYLYKCFGH